MATITGHKTRAVFDRYHIVIPRDLQEAAQKLAEPVSATGTAAAGRVTALRGNRKMSTAQIALPEGEDRAPCRAF